MKRVLSALLTVLLVCGLFPVSAMAAVKDYPKEFREGKTQTATFDGSTFLALQEDGSLWAMGDISMLGEKAPYDQKKDIGDDCYRYFADYPKKIAENVASYQGDLFRLGIIKTDGSLWVASIDTIYTGNGTGFVKKLDNVVEMSVSTHVLAVQQDGTLWAWGSDEKGALGLGDRKPDPSGSDVFEQYNTETPIKIMEGVKQVSASLHSLVLKEDGSVWSWGYNANGQVGTGKLPGMTGASVSGDSLFIEIGVCPAYERTPVKVMEGVKSIDTGMQYSLAIKNDDSLWGWGELPCQPISDDLAGQPIPLQIATDVKDTIPATQELFMIKKDNSLWGCGNYKYKSKEPWGSLTPQKVMDNVASATRLVSVGLLATKIDGTVWAIGRDYDGNLCTGGATVENPMLPRQGLLDDVIYVGPQIAIKENGSLWVFGYHSMSRDTDFFHTGAGAPIRTPIQLTGPANTPMKSAPAPSIKPAFTDVAATSPYAAAIGWAVDKGITAGTTPTTFSPNTTCTTGQILTFLWRANGSPAPIIANPFTDVKESDYYYKAALWAAEKGMVSGTTLGASAPCTRSATVTYLWKLAGEPSAAKEAAFADVPGGADYAKAVAWAVEKGITSGTSATTFAPDALCTRGQIVTFLHRDLGK